MIAFFSDCVKPQFSIRVSMFLLSWSITYLIRSSDSSIKTTSILHHCGLLGFSTQKLTWRSAAGVPFNIGVWNGPDGKGIVAALNATSYTSRVENRLDKSPQWIERLNEDKEKTGYAFDYRYYGVGDQGGAPRMNETI
jgi:alpha-mannosidase